jgi:hypothetical protein
MLTPAQSHGRRPQEILQPSAICVLDPALKFQANAFVPNEVTGEVLTERQILRAV